MPESDELLQNLLATMKSIDANLAKLTDDRHGIAQRMSEMERALREIATVLERRSDRAIDRIVS